MATDFSKASISDNLDENEPISTKSQQSESDSSNNAVSTSSDIWVIHQNLENSRYNKLEKFNYPHISNLYFLSNPDTTVYYSTGQKLYIYIYISKFFNLYAIKVRKFPTRILNP